MSKGERERRMNISFIKDITKGNHGNTTATDKSNVYYVCMCTAARKEEDIESSVSRFSTSLLV